MGRKRIYHSWNLYVSVLCNLSIEIQNTKLEKNTKIKHESCNTVRQNEATIIAMYTKGRMQATRTNFHQPRGEHNNLSK